MPYPTWQAGQRVTAAALTAMQPKSVVKQSLQSIANSTTYTADTELILALEAGATYLFMGAISYAALAAAGINMRWSYSGSYSTGFYSHRGLSGSSATTTDTTTIRAAQSNLGTGQALFGGNGAGSFLIAEPIGTIVTATAGNLFFEWSQNATNATATQVGPGSWVQALRVA